MSRIYSGVVLFLACVSLWSACATIDEKEFTVQKATTSFTYLVPISTGSLTIQKAYKGLDNVTLKQKSDGLLYLDYSSTKKTVQAKQMIVLSDQNISQSIDLPTGASGAIPANSTERDLVAQSFVASFSFADRSLSELQFRTTQLVVGYSFQPSNTVYKMRLTIPSLTLNGVPFTRVINPDEPITVSLADYVVKMDNNQLAYTISFIETVHNATTVSASTQAILTMQLKGIDYYYVKGYLGQGTFSNISETYDVSFLNKSIQEAQVTFADPALSFEIENGLGIPASLVYKRSDVQYADGSTVLMQLNPASPVAIAPAPMLKQYATTKITVTNGRAIGKAIPKSIIYLADCNVNDGLTTGVNFCADTSTVRIRLKAELPLYGTAQNIVLADTVSIGSNLSDVDVNEVTQAELVVKATNQLPFSTKLQLYLADENALITDTLVDSELVAASQVSATGDLQTAGVTDKSIPLDRSIVKKITKTKKLIIRATLNTSRTNNAVVDVKFKAAYALILKTALRFSATVNYTID